MGTLDRPALVADARTTTPAGPMSGGHDVPARTVIPWMHALVASVHEWMAATSVEVAAI